MAQTLKFVNGDMVRLFNNQGYEYVDAGEKVRQDVELILTTGVRSTTGLGCGLDDLIGEDTMDSVMAYAEFPVIFDFQQQVRIGLSRLRGTQRTYHLSQRSPKELIYDFSPVEIWRLAEDPRNYGWKVDIITEDGRTSFSLSGNARM